MPERSTATYKQDAATSAVTPMQLPLKAMLSALWRVKGLMTDTYANMVAASIAFYGLLAIFPAIAALISLWGLISDPAAVQNQIDAMSGFVPQEAVAIVSQQALKVSSNPQTGMSLTAIGGLLFTFYSASKGVRGFMAGLNIMYGESEHRGLIRQTLTNVILTMALVASTIVTLGALALVPLVLHFLPIHGAIEWIVLSLRWPLLLMLVMFSLALLYRFAPDRRSARWQWLTPGALAATILWLVGSIGFSVYVRNFSNYNETYGSLGAVVILLMWFWLSAYIVLLGAGINREFERETREDTTVGEDRPLGERNAFAADTLAGSDVEKKD
ncbi:YihY/virulence factor BrkB family protein [Larsenimonas salina]|uniref:YihY/virulence factor BrkB family protein n=1 Tax=Larsenimonas salina TaxID=1295565 RepID=UPI0020745EDF|nr:YihY/virulence factor BrkB family protein [Larsenimonas salina]MCM5704984.1 YihY/virulence factor BrkB family protein [Larsenimonas salina]